MQNTRGGPRGAAGSHKNVLKRKVGCDVTFEVGPAKEIISCHKIFLIARSSVFEDMFKGKWTNNVTTTAKEPIKLPEMDPGIFQSFLTFIYTDLIDTADMPCPHVEQLLYLAEKYNVLKLKNQCEEMLMPMVKLTNVIHIHSIAEQYSLTKLLTTSKYMMTEKFSELIADSSFLSMDAAVLTGIVGSDDTDVDELKLFNALMKWSEFKCKTLKLEPSGNNLRSVLGPILAQIRFPLMGSLKFRKHVAPSNILTTQEKLDIFEYMCLDKKGRANFDSSPSRLQFNVNKRKTGAKFNAKKHIYSKSQDTQSTRKQGAAASHIDVLKRKVGCDVSFEVGPAKKIISCHKIFLIARSSVFEVMFEDRWTNHGNKGNDVIIKLPDVDSGSFKSFLKFLYADLIEPADMFCSNIEKLLYLAEKYDVLELKNRCEEMLMAMLALNNVLHIHSIAEQFSLVRLLATAEHKITSEFRRLIRDASFLNLDTSLLTRFVASDDIDVDELNLFKALMNWSESQCKKLKLEPSGKNLRAVMGPILAHIRFPIMASWEFREFVVPRNILTDQEKLDVSESFSLGSLYRVLGKNIKIVSSSTIGLIRSQTLQILESWGKECITCCRPVRPFVTPS